MQKITHTKKQPKANNRQYTPSNDKQTQTRHKQHVKTSKQTKQTTTTGKQHTTHQRQTYKQHVAHKKTNKHSNHPNAQENKRNRKQSTQQTTNTEYTKNTRQTATYIEYNIIATQETNIIQTYSPRQQPHTNIIKCKKNSKQTTDNTNHPTTNKINKPHTTC